MRKFQLLSQLLFFNICPINKLNPILLSLSGYLIFHCISMNRPIQLTLRPRNFSRSFAIYSSNWYEFFVVKYFIFDFVLFCSYYSCINDMWGYNYFWFFTGDDFGMLGGYFGRIIWLFTGVDPWLASLTGEEGWFLWLEPGWKFPSNIPDGETFICFWPWILLTLYPAWICWWLIFICWGLWWFRPKLIWFCYTYTPLLCTLLPSTPPITLKIGGGEHMYTFWLP